MSYVSRFGYEVGLLIRDLGIALACRCAKRQMNRQRADFERGGLLEEWQQHYRSYWECMIACAVRPESSQFYDTAPDQEDADDEDDPETW